MDKNFAEQNLNSRSFRGQDLRGADFSGCQLKSCDFTDADLTGAKFCGAMLGVDGRRTFFKWILALMLGVASGLLVEFLNDTFTIAVNEIYDGLSEFDIFVEKNVVIAEVFYITSIGLAILAMLQYPNVRDIGRYYLLFIIVATGLIVAAGVAVAAGALAVVGVGALAKAEVVAEAMAVAITGTRVVAIVGAGVAAGAVAAATAVTLTGAAALAGVLAGAGVVAVALAGTLAGEGALITIIYVWLGWYLNRCAVISEDPALAWLRRYALAWRCWGGTQFSNALLAQTDFNTADLTGARFTDAKFRQPDFKGARNLHLAWTDDSPLQHKAVRLLLTDKRLENRDFSYQHLRGLSFKGSSLIGCNFYHADLSDSDFSDCDLTDAILSETLVFGTCFSKAKLTGVVIDNWGINMQTQFDNVICDFVYTQHDRSMRNPPQGTFKSGEFNKMRQESTTPFDFRAYNADESIALLRAINKINEHGGNIVIQGLGVNIQNQDSTKKVDISAKVNEQMEEELQALQQEKKLLLQKVEMQEQQTDILKQILKLAIESPKTMNDNSRRYGNITAQDSAVNLGDASTVNNHVEQVADAELKTALQDLQRLLGKSNLSTIDKQEAQQAINDLAEISQKPQAERKSLARRSLAFLKDLQQDLSSAAELGEQYGKLLVKVMAWF